MKYRELLDMIEEGENMQCEFKREFSSSEKIARGMIAFANTKGGFMLFGVDDDKKVVGVESEKETAELVNDVAKNLCEPALDVNIDYREVNGKEIVIVNIPESEYKPHRLQDYKSELDINSAIVTIRVNDKSVQASKEMIRILRVQTNQTALKKYVLGPVEKSVFEYLNKTEKISVKELSNLVNISERRASRTLVKMVRANLLMIHTKDNGEEFFTAAM
ncbi:MAG TPA: ATP-binding protein [Ignavibacteriaceae bacterium]|jgi:predicted HTH transcriptional regulator|nr:MAG: Divergent AAA domain protein [Ignavibacteria bacterium ADurb.Bin266]OQY71766.1 MAG: transcriptional regulator [Ignavibacteriales bacterium UTCHB2]HQF43330.1 ATP-binding protein [Ignavibacteriaceae bacterium]HQI41509.1 ATP-binding protein [Ignavibacteriaceae bacterium]HQJ47032.1 ATP-binding protein [Ignavibacteriaceae bacterium]